MLTAPDNLRDRAKLIGQKFYIGPACIRGHSGRRYVSSGGCVECMRSAYSPRRDQPSLYPLVREWRSRNRERVREYGRKQRQDPTFRAAKAISRAIGKALESGKAGRRWEVLVGYTLDDLRAHLERQFHAGMSWENYGSFWHIDHIVPKATFSAAEVAVCWGLPNLRPLPAGENVRKRSTRTHLL